jgi:micrococcal nuclease
MKKSISYTFIVLLLSLFAYGFSLIEQDIRPEKKVLSETTGIHTVYKVVDGDTIKVKINGKAETVRLLGIDTPETVDPRKPVQCFGKAASDKMKDLVLNKQVILENDPIEGDRDKYKRLLRYVYLNNSSKTFINGEMVKQGYAFSFRDYPTTLTDKFNLYEKYARENNLGLWGSCTLSPTPTINL